MKFDAVRRIKSFNLQCSDFLQCLCLTFFFFFLLRSIFSSVLELALRYGEVVEGLEQEAASGVFHVKRMAPAGELDRQNFPLFGVDPTHADLLEKGFRPMFPAQNDLPMENERVSQDVFYFPGKDDVHAFHRVTVNRAHEPGSGIVFVDGSVAFLQLSREKFHGAWMFDRERFQSNVADKLLSSCTFHLDGWKICLIKNGGINGMRLAWSLGWKRYPEKWAILFDEVNAETGETMEITIKRGKCCPYSIPMIVLWPFWTLWFLFWFFIGSCFLFLCIWKTEVRRFHIKMHEGVLRMTHSEENDDESRPLLN